MKKWIQATVQSSIFQHSIFWTVAGFVLYRITAYSSDTSWTDIYYVLLFLIPAAWVVYSNILLINRWLAIQRYGYWLLGSTLGLLSGVAGYFFIMNYLVDYIFPGYYFISYYQFGEILIFLSAFWVISTLLTLSKGWFRAQEQKQQIQLLEKAKTQAELDALKAQLDPHFLFNNLNSLYSLALEDHPKTSEAILKLAESLRYVLYEGQQELVNVQQEIQHAQNYLQLQQWRFGEEMNISLELAIDSGKQVIAPLLLLPLLENSFKHVGRNRNQLYAVQGKISLHNGYLHVMLQNTISAQPMGQDNLGYPGGIGLKNLQKRLEILYPGKHYFNTMHTQDEFVAKLELQLKP